jgi:hypothetical protein
MLGYTNHPEGPVNGYTMDEWRQFLAGAKLDNFASVERLVSFLQRGGSRRTLSQPRSLWRAKCAFSFKSPKKTLGSLQRQCNHQ